MVSGEKSLLIRIYLNHGRGIDWRWGRSERFRPSRPTARVQARSDGPVTRCLRPPIFLLVRNLWLSFDPGQRTRLLRNAYVPMIQIGEVMQAFAHLSLSGPGNRGDVPAKLLAGQPARWASIQNPLTILASIVTPWFSLVGHKL
jgi:hypothetical protein